MNTFKFNWPIIAARLIHLIRSFARAKMLRVYKENDISSLFYLEAI